MSDDPARRQSFLEAWALLDRMAKFRNITIVVQLISVVLVIIGFIVAANGGPAFISYIGVAGIIAMVIVRLIAAATATRTPGPFNDGQGFKGGNNRP